MQNTFNSCKNAIFFCTNFPKSPSFPLQQTFLPNILDEKYRKVVQLPQVGQIPAPIAPKNARKTTKKSHFLVRAIGCCVIEHIKKFGASRFLPYLCSTLKT